MKIIKCGRPTRKATKATLVQSLFMIFLSSENLPRGSGISAAAIAERLNRSKAAVRKRRHGDSVLQ